MRKKLSVRANHALWFGGYEKASDVLSRLTDKKNILLLRNCGLTTTEEIFEMVCRLRQYNASLNETNKNIIEAIQRQMAIRELPLSEDHFIQRHYELLLNRLSVRTHNIVECQGFLQWKKFEPYLKTLKMRVTDLKFDPKKWGI